MNPSIMLIRALWTPRLERGLHMQRHRSLSPSSLSSLARPRSNITSVSLWFRPLFPPRPNKHEALHAPAEEPGLPTFSEVIRSLGCSEVNADAKATSSTRVGESYEGSRGMSDMQVAWQCIAGHRLR